MNLVYSDTQNHSPKKYEITYGGTALSVTSNFVKIQNLVPKSTIEISVKGEAVCHIKFFDKFWNMRGFTYWIII